MFNVLPVFYLFIYVKHSRFQDALDRVTACIFSASQKRFVPSEHSLTAFASQVFVMSAE